MIIDSDDDVRRAVEDHLIVVGKIGVDCEAIYFISPVVKLSARYACELESRAREKGSAKLKQPTGQAAQL